MIRRRLALSLSLVSIFLLALLFQNCSGGTIGGNPLDSETPIAEKVAFEFDPYNPVVGGNSVTSISICMAFIELRYTSYSGEAPDAHSVVEDGNGGALIRYLVEEQVLVEPSGAFIAELDPPTGEVDRISFINVAPGSPAAAGLNLNCTIAGNLQVTNSQGTFDADNYDTATYFGSYTITDDLILGFSLQNLIDAVADATSDSELETAVNSL